MKMEIRIVSEGEPIEALQAIAAKLAKVSESVTVSITQIENLQAIRPDYSSETVRQTAVTLKVTA
jgi:hypothetical protein